MPYAILLAFAFVSALLAGQTAQLNTTFDRLNETGTVSVETENQTTVEPAESNITGTAQSVEETAPLQTTDVTQPTESNISGTPDISTPPSGDAAPTSTQEPTAVSPQPSPAPTQPSSLPGTVYPKLVPTPAPSVKEEPKAAPAPQIIHKELKPVAAFKSPLPGKIQGSAAIELAVKDALSVEFNVRKSNSLVSRYLGSGQRKEESKWTFSWNTSLTPNAHYELYAVITNEFGQYESGTVSVVVLNAVAAAPETQKKIVDIKEQVQIKEVETTEKKETEKVNTVEAVEQDVKNFSEKLKIDLPPQEAKKVDDAVKTVTQELKPKVEIHLKELGENISIIKQEEVKRKTAEELPAPEIATEKKEQVIKEITEKIKEEQQKQTEVRQEIAKTIEEAKEKIIQALPEPKRQEAEPVKAAAVKGAEQLIAQFETNVGKHEEEKIGEAASVAAKDSDKDGMSDYEEIFRFNTDPFAIDSDGDGFNDGVEVASGYNPLDPSPADQIVYEEPKAPEAGVVQPQTFKVEEVKVVEKAKTETGAEVIKKMEIKGKALPNSFVTIYIYSLPIIVTVKADANGAWTYTLDKELDDGEHEIYVATTDNTGKIAAKSAPFTFTKQAAAITLTGITLPAVAPSAEVPSFLSTTYLILTLSLIAFILGVGLLVIGLLTMKRERQQPPQSPQSPQQ